MPIAIMFIWLNKLGPSHRLLPIIQQTTQKKNNSTPIWHNCHWHWIAVAVKHKQWWRISKFKSTNTPKNKETPSMCLYVVNWSVFTPAFHSMLLLRLFAFHSLFFFTFVRWLLLHFLRLGSAFATTTRIHIQKENSIGVEYQRCKDEFRAYTNIQHRYEVRRSDYSAVRMLCAAVVCYRVSSLLTI